jgi:shikimate kinase
MQRIALLVGPAGAGKTTAIQLAQKAAPQYLFRCLDADATDYALRQRWIAERSIFALADNVKNRDHFLAVGLQAIADLAARQEEKSVLFDVGSGFQDATYAPLLPSFYPTIYLWCDPPIAYGRWKARGREALTLTAYKRSEFTEHRHALYAHSHCCIDTSWLTPGQVAERLLGVLPQILA